MGNGGEESSGKAGVDAAHAPSQSAQKVAEKKSGEEMIAAPLVHVDETFWLGTVAFLCYCGDYWALVFMVMEPLVTYLLCRAISTPGDPDKARNNIIPVDLRDEFSAPKEVVESIMSGELVEATDGARPNSEWVRYFPTSLAPDSMDRFDKTQQRLLCVMAQGKEYLPKASNATLAMIIYSVALAALLLSRYGWFKVAKLLAIQGSHINLSHILRDHSVSGLTHHGAHNVGEFDKIEFIRKSFRKSLFLAVLSFVIDWQIVHLLATLFAVKCIGFANHTLTHYTRLDVKGKGPGGGLLWGLVLDLQSALAACKLITSKQYHAQHHFHNEMSYPAILMPVNEYWNAKSLTPFLSRTMDGKRLAQVEKVLFVGFNAFMYCAIAA